MEPPREQRRSGGRAEQRQRHQGKEVNFSKRLTCPTGTVPSAAPIPRELMESLFLEVLKQCGDVALRDIGQWAILLVCG